MQNSNTLPQTGFVRLPQVLAVYPVSKSKLYADIKAGKFPSPVKLSERVSAWKVETLRAFLEAAGEL
jgi:prophage regulatory protein